MVSIAPNTQSYLYNHMSFFTDLRSKKEGKMCTHKNSLYDYLCKAGNFTRFKKIVDTADLAGKMDDLQANWTLFAPTDEYLQSVPDSFFLRMDVGTARQIVNASIIPRKLAKDLLTSSPVCYFYTRNPSMRMYVTNINNRTVINNCVSIVNYDIWCCNGILHVVDELIQPSEDHFMN